MSGAAGPFARWDCQLSEFDAFGQLFGSFGPGGVRHASIAACSHSFGTWYMSSRGGCDVTAAAKLSSHRLSSCLPTGFQVESQSHVTVSPFFILSKSWQCTFQVSAPRSTGVIRCIFVSWSRRGPSQSCCRQVWGNRFATAARGFTIL